MNTYADHINTIAMDAYIWSDMQGHFLCVFYEVVRCEDQWVWQNLRKTLCDVCILVNKL